LLLYSTFVVSLTCTVGSLWRKAQVTTHEALQFVLAPAWENPVFACSFGSFLFVCCILKVFI